MRRWTCTLSSAACGSSLHSFIHGSKYASKAMQSTSHQARKRAGQRAASLGKEKAEKKASGATGAGGTFAARSNAKNASAPMRGRFNRIARERGLLFASYFYIVGESLNLFGTYLLYTHQIPYIGDAGSWLEGAGVSREKYLDIGPVVLGLRLSPVLFLDYMVANCFFYPFIAYELAFCSKTAALCGAVAAKFRPTKVSPIPKAPPISSKK